jgi:hypothetical protein
VAEMKGPNMRSYQEMWYFEHMSWCGRKLPAGALSHGQGAGKWLIGKLAWQDHIISFAIKSV